MIEVIKKDLEEVFLNHQGRLKHIFGVYEKSIKLAKQYHVDEYKCAVIALLHDYTKKLSSEEQIMMLNSRGISLPISEKMYHAYTSSIIAKEKYNINDEELLNAIKYHTTGYFNPSIYAKILMIADATEESTRSGEFTENLRALEYETLEGALIFKLEYVINKLLDKGLVVSSDTYECLNSLKEKRK